MDTTAAAAAGSGCRRDCRSCRRRRGGGTAAAAGSGSGRDCHRRGGCNCHAQGQTACCRSGRARTLVHGRCRLCDVASSFAGAGCMSRYASCCWPPSGRRRSAAGICTQQLQRDAGKPPPLPSSTSLPPYTVVPPHWLQVSSNGAGLVPFFAMLLDTSKHDPLRDT